MNRIVTLLIIIAIALSFSFAYGPGPGLNENSYIIHGDGFNNQLVRLEIKTNDFTSNQYGRGTYNFYEGYENMTIKVSGKNNVLATSPIVGFNIDFNEFGGVGRYTLDSAVSFSVYFKKATNIEEYDSYYMLDSDGEINLTKYGQVGELIEGTFSGKFTKMKIDKVTGHFTDTGTEVLIKDGKFSVVRFPDFHWDAVRSTGKEPEDFKKSAKK